MSASLIPNIKFRWLDNNGNPLAGGLVYTFISGTSTPAVTYSDDAGTIPNTNPVVLDSAGFAPIYLDDDLAYRITVKTSTGTTLQTVDDVIGTSPTVQASVILDDAITATQGQTVFSTPAAYTPDSNALQVSVNGAVQVVDVDYTETDTTHITFSTGLNAGDVVYLRLFSTSVFTAPAASQVTISDAGGYFTSSTVEGALQEVGAADVVMNSSIETLTTASDPFTIYIGAAPYGAATDGTTDVTSIVQQAEDDLEALGGGTIVFGPYTYRVQMVKKKDHIRWVGIPGSTIIKVPDGVDKQVMYNENQSTAPYTPVSWVELEGIIFDGNQAAAPRTTATSTVALNGLEHFTAKNCTFRNGSGYGLGLQGQPGYTSTTVRGSQLDIYLENCYFIDNGIGAASGGDTYDGLDVKTCKRLTMVHCFAYGNYDKGINARGYDITIIGGEVHDNGTSGYSITDNPNGDGTRTTCLIAGASAYNNAGAGGFEVAQTTVGSTFPVQVTLCGCQSYSNLYGVSSGSFNDYCDLAIDGCHIYENTSHGMSIAGAMRHVGVTNTVIRDNGGSGIAASATDHYVTGGALTGNTRYGFEETGTGTRSVISGGTQMTGNTLGGYLAATNKRTVITGGAFDYVIGTGDVIASASTVTLPQAGDYFVITGTTNINTITASWRGRRLTLSFTGILTVNDGAGNLGLAGNFTTTSSDTLSLVCDGSTWLETSRSIN